MIPAVTVTNCTRLGFSWRISNSSLSRVSLWIVFSKLSDESSKATFYYKKYKGTMAPIHTKYF
jgi:hypothetical protein